MKNILFIAILMIVFSCNQQKSRSDNTSTNVTTTDTVNLAYTEFEITGMTCTGCENTINGCVKKLTGVDSVSSDHIAGIAFVKYDSTKVKPEQIVDAINNTGYSAKVKGLK